MKNDKAQPISLDDIDLERLRDKIAEQPGLIQFPHHVGSAIVKPEDKGRVKGRSVAAMHDQTEKQLSQIFEQIQHLAQQAQKIKDRIEISEMIYLADMNFEPIIHKHYYLYERPNHERVLSMIGPKEWGSTMPFSRFVAEVKLLSDHTWEVIEKPASDSH